MTELLKLIDMDKIDKLRGYKILYDEDNLLMYLNGHILFNK
jgi:hypothetical protein